MWLFQCFCTFINEFEIFMFFVLVCNRKRSHSHLPRNYSWKCPQWSHWFVAEPVGRKICFALHLKTTWSELHHVNPWLLWESPSAPAYDPPSDIESEAEEPPGSVESLSKEQLLHRMLRVERSLGKYRGKYSEVRKQTGCLKSKV